MDAWRFYIGLFYIVIAVLGVGGNGIMVAASACLAFRTHSVCHFLITLICLTDMLHQCSQFVFSYTIFYPTEMTQSFCFYILSLPAFGAISASTFCLSLGVDRLFAVVYPNRYKYLHSIHLRTYTLCLLLVPAAYIAYMAFLAISERSDHIVTTCGIPYALAPPAMEFWTNSTLIINIMLIIIYVIAWLKIRTCHLGKRFRAVFFSIFITVIFVILGWIPTTVINTLSFILVQDEMNRFIMQIFAGISVNLSLACNIVVYYMISSEYRQEIRYTLCLDRTTLVPLSLATNGQFSRSLNEGSDYDHSNGAVPK